MKAPITIYLQNDPEGETTWCEDKINDDDVEYVQFAEVSRLTAEKERALEDVRTSALHIGSLNDDIHALTTELAALKEKTRWRKYPDENPENDGLLPREYCSYRFTGNNWEVYACSFWCKYELGGRVAFGEVTYNFYKDKFSLSDGLEATEDIVVIGWQPLPRPPEEE